MKKAIIFGNGLNISSIKEEKLKTQLEKIYEEIKYYSLIKKYYPEIDNVILDFINGKNEFKHYRIDLEKYNTWIRKQISKIDINKISFEILNDIYYNSLGYNLSFAGHIIPLYKKELSNKTSVYNICKNTLINKLKKTLISKVNVLENEILFNWIKKVNIEKFFTLNYDNFLEKYFEEKNEHKEIIHLHGEMTKGNINFVPCFKQIQYSLEGQIDNIEFWNNIGELFVYGVSSLTEYELWLTLLVNNKSIKKIHIYCYSDDDYEGFDFYFKKHHSIRSSKNKPQIFLYNTMDDLINNTIIKKDILVEKVFEMNEKIKHNKKIKNIYAKNRKSVLSDFYLIKNHLVVNYELKKLSINGYSNLYSNKSENLVFRFNSKKNTIEYLEFFEKTERHIDNKNNIHDIDVNSFAIIDSIKMYEKGDMEKFIADITIIKYN